MMSAVRTESVSLHLHRDDGRPFLDLELDDDARAGVIAGQGVGLDGLEIVQGVQLGLDVQQQRIDGERLPDVGLQDRVEIAFLDGDQPGEREALDGLVDVPLAVVGGSR